MAPGLFSLTHHLWLDLPKGHPSCLGLCWPRHRTQGWHSFWIPSAPPPPLSWVILTRHALGHGRCPLSRLESQLGGAVVGSRERPPVSTLALQSGWPVQA